jgi:hypothetical protein
MGKSPKQVAQSVSRQSQASDDVDRCCKKSPENRDRPAEFVHSCNLQLCFPRT